jgi:hypothetical protein
MKAFRTTKLRLPKVIGSCTANQVISWSMHEIRQQQYKENTNYGLFK